MVQKYSIQQKPFDYNEDMDERYFEARMCTYRMADNPRHTTPYDMTANELMADWADMAGCSLTGEMLYRGKTFIMLDEDGFELHGCFYEIKCWSCGNKYIDVHWDDTMGAIEICPICGADGEM